MYESFVLSTVFVFGAHEMQIIWVLFQSKSICYILNSIERLQKQANKTLQRKMNAGRPQLNDTA